MSYVMRNRTLTLNLWQMHMHMHAHKDLCIHTPMHAPTTPMNTQVNNYEWTKPLKCTGAGKSQWNRYSLFLMPNWLEKSTQTTFKIYARNVLSGLQKDGMNAARCSICLICTSAVGFFWWILFGWDFFFFALFFPFIFFVSIPRKQIFFQPSRLAMMSGFSKGKAKQKNISHLTLWDWLIFASHRWPAENELFNSKSIRFLPCCRYDIKHKKHRAQGMEVKMIMGSCLGVAAQETTRIVVSWIYGVSIEQILSTDSWDGDSVSCHRLPCITSSLMP